MTAKRRDSGHSSDLPDAALRSLRLLLGDIMNRHKYLEQLWNSTAAVANRLEPEGEFFRTTIERSYGGRIGVLRKQISFLFLHLFLFVFSLGCKLLKGMRFETSDLTHPNPLFCLESVS